VKLNYRSIKMRTRITTKPKKCLKFEGYIYLPNKNATKKALRYYASRTAGRLIVYDEFGKKIGAKNFAFGNLGEMINFIEKIRRKIVYERTK
jgi:hypothetical protein